MRVFDFDGTIYDGESLFDLYLYSARHDPKVFRYIAPVLRYAVKYKLGRATLEQMEYGVGKMTEGYLTELSRSKRVASVEQLVDDFWDRYYARIKPWYQPESDDVILTASFGLTVGKACRISPKSPSIGSNARSSFRWRWRAAVSCPCGSGIWWSP